MRGSKRELKQHTKNTTTTTNNLLFQGPGPSLQKSPPKTAKKSPPGGQNDPQERPRRGRERPKRSQDDPKSAPRAGGLREPWWPPGADLAPKRLSEPSGEAFWPPRGWILAPPGLPFRSFQRFLRSLAGSRRKRKSGSAGASAKRKRRGPRAKDSRQQGRQASRTRGPGGMCGAP